MNACSNNPVTAERDTARESVSMSYSYRPNSDGTGTTTYVTKQIEEEIIFLPDLIDEIAEFIEAAGWIFPSGQTLGLVNDA